MASFQVLNACSKYSKEKKSNAGTEQVFQIECPLFNVETRKLNINSNTQI